MAIMQGKMPFVFGVVVLATLLVAAPAAHAACRSPKNICKHFDDCLQRTSDPNNKDADGIRAGVKARNGQIVLAGADDSITLCMKRRAPLPTRRSIKTVRVRQGVTAAGINTQAPLFFPSASMNPPQIPLAPPTAAQDDREARYCEYRSHFYWICRGIDRRPVLPNRIRKSIGAENTFSRDLSSLDDMRAELDPLVDKVWHYCESIGVRGRTVTLKVKFANFQIITRSRSYIAPISDRSTLASISEELLAAHVVAVSFCPIRCRPLCLVIREKSQFRAQHEDHSR